MDNVILIKFAINNHGRNGEVESGIKGVDPGPLGLPVLQADRLGLEHDFHYFIQGRNCVQDSQDEIDGIGIFLRDLVNF